MFLAIVFIVLGLFLLLNAMGLIAGVSFWAFFWAVLFLAIGIKMLMRKGRCPICSGMYWTGNVRQKIYDKMHDNCACEEEREKVKTKRGEKS